MTPGVGGSAATPTENSTTSLHELAAQRRAASMSASSNPQGISREIANPETAQKSRSKANETFNIFNAMRANFEKSRNIQILKKLLAPVLVIISIFKKIYPSSAKTAHQKQTTGKTSPKSDTSSPKASRSESKASVKVTDESEVPRLKSSEELKFEGFVKHPETMTAEDAEKLDSFLRGPSGGSLLDHLVKLGNEKETQDSFVEFLAKMSTSLSPESCSVIMEKLTDEAGLDISKKLVSRELPESKQATLFRENSIASRMVSAYQNNLMVKEMDSELKALMARLPNEPYQLKKHAVLDKDKQLIKDPIEADRIVKENQNRLMEDFSKIMDEVDTLTKSDKFPSKIIELNQFIKTEVDKKYPGLGENFAPQFFFLRFFNPALIKDEITPERRNVGIMLGQLVQKLVNKAPELENDNLHFFFEVVNNEGNKEKALLNEISKRLSTPVTQENVIS